MSSERRINASRANGAKSQGPVSPEGRLASSRNSLRHGLLSKTVVLAGESREAFIELLTSYQDEHKPETPTEEGLIENMAIARWRQQRIWNLETAGMDNQISHPKYIEGDDYPTQAFVAFRTLTDDTRSLELLNRYEARFDRQFRTSLEAFQRLRAKRDAAKPDPPPSSTKLFWIDGSRAHLVADASNPQLVCPLPDDDPRDPTPEAPVPATPVGSFGNRVFPAKSVDSEPHLMKVFMRLHSWLKLPFLALREPAERSSRASSPTPAW